MSLFDLWKKRSKQKEPDIIKKTSTSEGQRKSSFNAQSRTSIQRKTNSEIEITNTARLSRYIELSQKPEDVDVSLLCPLRPAKIYCHSVLVDKLGVMTRFIIQSLSKGKTIEEIQELTRIGERAMEEEIAFLVNGQLMEIQDGVALTSLGIQYGQLLERFDALSEGIPVVFNSFADLFEEAKTTTSAPAEKDAFCLPEDFSMVLTRDEDYKNSLDIAKRRITEDIPFCDKIKDSIHTTVWISKEKPTRFKQVFIKDFRYGRKEPSPGSYPIRIPIDRVSLKPRYKSLEKYEAIIEHLIALSEVAAPMLSAEAVDLATMAREEQKAETIVVDVNAITGYMSRYLAEMNENDNPSLLTLDAASIPLKLSEGAADKLFLEEVSRERYYETVFFSYSQMETQ